MAVDADAPDGQLNGVTDDAVDGAPGAAEGSEVTVRQAFPSKRAMFVAGLVIVVALGALTSWLGYQANQERHAQQQRDLFLHVGRQAAVNLTTIDHVHADADVQRILDCAVAPFRDEFQQRATAFIEVVKKARSKSEGTVTAAGLESTHADKAQVLVAVAVKTSTGDTPEQQPRAWRMRVDVEKVGDGAKVSNVAFVP